MSAQIPPVPMAAAEGFVLPMSPSDDQDQDQDQNQNHISLVSHVERKSFRAGVGLENVARRTLGIILLLCTVFLWTASNFLASNIFADNSFSKPYFVTYINVSFFAISLLPMFIRVARQKGILHIKDSVVEHCRSQLAEYTKRLERKSRAPDEVANLIDSSDPPMPREDEAGLLSHGPKHTEDEDMLSVPEIAKLSLEFCLLWFVANYLVAACLEYTSVGSSTILYSTSSIFTLLFGAIAGVERFNWKKLTGVLASFSGIILVSLVDLSGADNDDTRGSFPHKSSTEIAIGDTMAFGSAIMYGLYAVVMKKNVGNEDRVNMLVFFGLVGLFNLILLWPGFFVLHFTGVETFELPPSGKIWTIVILNSLASFVSDYCWAYAMLLTTPLVVTVGISMSIPLSLIAQMVLNSQHSNWVYWIGACIVILSFLFINHESHDQDESQRG